ncbi:uncharacterized protein K02A2.6-like [Schistocerca americana]|uniref:uncharacterized protein K02A2.6-like n=1 Tax=Schistocerca americana TaxID=7009 RepID=UPI001F4F5CEF|nr:uncharacterized protein K02A2.6-like [Schistocerca americana]
MPSSAHITAKQISKETDKDKIVSVVLSSVKNNKLPNKVQYVLKAIGESVTISSSLRPRLKKVSPGHLETTKMENRERKRNRQRYSRVNSALTKNPFHPWQRPRELWESLHTDFVKFPKRMYLVVMDTYSKWPEAIKMSHSTVTSTIGDALIPLFPQFGLPEMIV